MPFGAELQADGRVRFRLWAPPHREVQIELDGKTVAMRPIGEGWHELLTDRARAGTRYRFVLPDGLRVPDPASRYQPEDVHGPSEVVDPAAYAWRDAGWTGRPWEEAVVYELHIGAFTPEGTFRAAIESSTIWLRLASPQSRLCRSVISPAAATGAMTACCPTRRILPMGGPRT